MYSPLARKENFSFPIDFFARRTHFVDHIAPIWNELGEQYKGVFYVPQSILGYASGLVDKTVGLKPIGSSAIRVSPHGRNPILTCAYGDLERAISSFPTRAHILMEHGVGLSFGHPGYGGGEGLRRRVNLFLAPNKNIYNKTHKTFPQAPQCIIGTPKMDGIVPSIPVYKKDPVVGISFHWNGEKVCPEAGNALEYYMEVLPELSGNFRVIGHGHPKIIDKLRSIYRACCIDEIEPDFSKIMQRCDIYVNDASSTMYEFSCTGKPVVILNAPWFRKDVYHGIRFWDYTNIGIQVDNPADLIGAITETAKYPERHYENRLNMINDLYPYLGSSSKRAAQAIVSFIRSKRNGTAFKVEEI
jgi:hypothetical protein